MGGALLATLTSDPVAQRITRKRITRKTKIRRSAAPIASPRARETTKG
jgi:hypothetical protein